MPDSVGSLLADALARYRESDPEGLYDEVLTTVAERAADEGSLGKADIGSLVMWKRITAQTRWAAALGMTPDREVREATAKAWSAANDGDLSVPEAGQRARDALRSVPGLGGPALASAVLLACAPARMAVWDRRVASSLAALGQPALPNQGFYRAYLDQLLALAGTMEQATEAASPNTPRHVDLALYQLAGSEDLRSRAATLVH